MGQEDRNEVAKGKTHTIIEQEKLKERDRNDRQKKTRQKRFPEPQSHADRSPGWRGDRPHRQAVGQEGTEKCSVGGREAERLERLLRERELRKREGDGLITL